MGVTGLLPLLKSIQRPSELKKYSGKTLGVDAYGWLHRGAIACASELAQGKPTRKYVPAVSNPAFSRSSSVHARRTSGTDQGRYVQFAMNRVNMLRHFGVTPYIVFDGDFLPSKAGTEASRAKSREEHARQGKAFLEAGKRTLAEQEFQKAIDVTPEMARHLIEELKKMGIEYVVAPYEADPQLVYLERQGLVDGVLSEDSDLLVFGCKRLITKLDKYGSCVEINRRDFCAVREVSLTGWTDTDFRRMAILSGCDYLEGLRGTGLKTAYRHLRAHKTPEKVVQRLRFEGKTPVSENYLPAFYQAELTFLHQRVFCPERRELVMLTEDPTGKAKDLPFIGADVEPELARAIARGDVNPITKQPIRITGTSPKRQRAPSMAAAKPAAPVRPPAGAKPINSYFKRSTRIPMGEMDRNCFAVDKQRVADITHNGLVPRVFPLPRPYLDPSRAPRTSQSQRRRTDGIASSLERIGYNSEANRRHTAGPDVLAPENDSNASAQRPPKKARLCNNEEKAEVDDDQASAGRSKFFPSKPSKPADAEETSTDTTTAPKRDDLLFSDDSIEEALLTIPTEDDWDFISKPRKSQSFKVFSDVQEATTPESRAESPPGTEEAQPESSAEDATHSPAPDRPTSTPPRLPSARVSLESFFYKSDQNEGSEAQTPASTTSTAPSSRSSIFTPSFGASQPATPFTAASMMTPLQRLGSRALGTKLSTPSAVRNENAKNKRASLDRLPVNPAFVPLPKVDLDEVAALNCGSEDQIPLIDADEAEEDPGERVGPRPSVPIDLSRFMHR